MVEFDLEVDEVYGSLTMNKDKTEGTIHSEHRISLKFKVKDWRFIREHIDELVAQLENTSE